MIAACKHCTWLIRDQSVARPSRWYHTRSGHERCEGRKTLAQPRPAIGVSCPRHRYMVLACYLCWVAMRVSEGLHNENRCIPASCGWLHQTTGR